MKTPLISLVITLLYAGVGLCQAPADVSHAQDSGTTSGAQSATAPQVRSVVIEGSRLRVRGEDGAWVPDEKLLGAVLVAGNEGGEKSGFRIDGIDHGVLPNVGEMYWYALSVRNPATGEWQEACGPDKAGKRRGLILSGYWDAGGLHHHSDTEYSIACSASTFGKCVLFGYAPWLSGPRGESLWDYHQACTRLLRADYCGNGTGHTRTGTMVELFDRLDIQTDSHAPDLSFESAWNENGAVCLRTTRITELASLESIFAECPEKLSPKNGGVNCREDFGDPRVKILNRSPLALHPPPGE